MDISIIDKQYDDIKKRFMSLHGKPRYERSYDNGSKRIAWDFYEDKNSIYILLIRYTPKRKKGLFKISLGGMSKDSLGEEH
jgi:hypothetical protein